MTSWSAARAVLLAAVLGAGLSAVGPGPAVGAPVPVPLNDCVPTDNGDPVVIGLTISPTSVDLSAGPRAVTVTVVAEDTGGPGPTTGIRSGSVNLAPADGPFGASHPLTPVSPTTWQARVLLVPATGRDGTLRPLVAFQDRAGGPGSYLTADELTAQGLAAAVEVRDPTPLDTRPPTMASLRLSTRSVDTRSGARSVAIQARWRDGRSGVDHVSVSTMVGRTRLQLARGTRRDGVWTGRITVGRWVGSQTASLYVKGFDRAGARQTYGRRALQRHGWPGAFEVVARSDVHGPVPTALTTLPAALDVRGGDRSVPVRLRVTDDRSGTAAVAGYLTDGSYRSPRSPLRLVSGTSHDGVWEGTIVLPDCSAGTATYQLGVRTQDVRGASRERPVTARTMAVTAGDHSLGLPIVGEVLSWGPPARLRVTFAEDVVGLSEVSALVRRTEFRPAYRVSTVAGTWTCADPAATRSTASPVRCARPP